MRVVMLKFTDAAPDAAIEEIMDKAAEYYDFTGGLSYRTQEEPYTIKTVEEAVPRAR